MKPIVLNVRFAVKERLLKGLRRCRDAGDKTRYLVIVNLLNGDVLQPQRLNDMGFQFAG